MSPHSPVTAERADYELEQQADELLYGRTPNPARMEYSFYRTATLSRFYRRDREGAMAPPPDMSMMSETAAELLEALFSEVDLPERMRRVMALVRYGLDDRQIAQALGIRHRTAQRWRQAAVRTLRRHCLKYVESADPTVRQAYEEQLHPTVYNPEMHCAAGQEACREDGICRRRWYLYREEPQE